MSYTQVCPHIFDKNIKDTIEEMHSYNVPEEELQSLKSYLNLSADYLWLIYALGRNWPNSDVIDSINSYIEKIENERNLKDSCFYLDKSHLDTYIFYHGSVYIARYFIDKCIDSVKHDNTSLSLYNPFGFLDLCSLFMKIVHEFYLVVSQDSHDYEYVKNSVPQLLEAALEATIIGHREVQEIRLHVTNTAEPEFKMNLDELFRSKITLQTLKSNLSSMIVANPMRYEYANKAKDNFEKFIMDGLLGILDKNPKEDKDNNNFEIPEDIDGIFDE